MPYPVDYPTELNFADPCGRYYGPTSEETRHFPEDVYLTADEYRHYQAEAFLAAQLEAQAQFERQHPGQPNPYDKPAREGAADLLRLPPLPDKPCGSA